MLKEASPDIFQKLVPIQGDVSDENLGISPADRKTLIDNVNVVIHSAATLDFHEPLLPTVNTNLLGTRRIMELCSQAHNLTSMVHVSSAYVNSYLVECEEKLYPPPAASAEKVIELCEKLGEEELAKETPTLLGEHPNSYTFTKQLAEYEVVKCANKFPCGIVRPSMSKSYNFKMEMLNHLILIDFLLLFLVLVYSYWIMERTDSRMDYI